MLTNELQKLPKITRDLIERFTKEIYLDCRCKSERSKLAVLVAFVSKLDLKPTVSSKMYR